MQNKHVGGRKKKKEGLEKVHCMETGNTQRHLRVVYLKGFFFVGCFFPLFFFFSLYSFPPPFYFLRNPNAHPVCWIFAWLCIPPCLKQLPSAPLARLTLQSTVNIPVEVKPLRGGGGAPRRLSRAGAAAPPQLLPSQPATNLPRQYFIYFSSTKS